MRGIIAIGAGGASMVETLIHFAMSGALREDLECVLTGVPPETAERLERLAGDYGCIHSLYAARDHEAFAAGIHLSFWPENGMELSLEELASSETDQQVLKLLFARDKTLRRDLGILESAGAAWVEQLAVRPSGSLRALIDSVLEGVLPLTVVGDLTEAVCSAGAGKLMRSLMESERRLKITGIFSGPVFLSQDEGNCQSALLGIPDGLYSLYYYALPRDLRMQGEKSKSIADLAFLGCFLHALGGRSGEYAFASGTGVPGFDYLGDAGTVFREKETAFVRASLLTLLDMGPGIQEYLASSGFLDFSRSGVRAVCYSGIRRETETRDAEMERMNTLMRLMKAHGEYLYEIASHVPVYFLNRSGMQKAVEKAKAHYIRLLDLAGQKALMDYDAEKSGISREETVHRGSMEETEAEKNRRLLGEISEKLEAMQEEQSELNQAIGGRSLHAMLSSIAAERMEEAEDLKEQGREAARRIEKAAAVARVEEIPRVDAARNRLERLNRHYVLLEGKRQQAEKDAELARSNAVRTAAPSLSMEGALPDILFPRRVLESLASGGGKDKRERKSLMSEVSACWPEAGLEKALADLGRVRQDGNTLNGTARFLELLMTETDGDWRS